MICRYCHKDKPATEFEVARKHKGKVYRRRKCKRCKQNTQNLRRRRNREWLTEYKKKSKCNRCGNTDYRCLVFHHTSSKDYAVSNLVCWSIDRLKEEISKCKVLCMNCHGILHWKENK